MGYISKRNLDIFRKKFPDVLRSSKFFHTTLKDPHKCYWQGPVSRYLRTDFHAPRREAFRWCTAFPILTYISGRSCSIQFHTLCIPLRSGTSYNRPVRCSAVVQRKPRRRICIRRISPVESPRPCRAPCPGMGRGNPAWVARGIETRRAHPMHTPSVITRLVFRL